MAPGALEDGDGPFFCGCRACAEKELEFSGLVDLVEKRFFEAGVREPELEEACDPAWKVVDESGYAEGGRSVPPGDLRHPPPPTRPRSAQDLPVLVLPAQERPRALLGVRRKTRDVDK